MLKLNDQAETGALQKAAEHLYVAARTVPKGKGKDLLVTAVVSGDEKISCSSG